MVSTAVDSSLSFDRSDNVTSARVSGRDDRIRTAPSTRKEMTVGKIQGTAIYRRSFVPAFLFPLKSCVEETVDRQGQDRRHDPVEACRDLPIWASCPVRDDHPHQHVQTMQQAFVQDARARRPWRFAIEARRTRSVICIRLSVDSGSV